MTYAIEPVCSGDGTHIAVRRGGKGARPVVFVHGTASTGARWRPVADLMSTDCSVLTFDRRGRGESGDGPAYSLDREVGDLRAVIEAVANGTAVDVVGHSFGALIALITATQAPALFRKLVLYEAPLARAGDPAFVDLPAVSKLEEILAAGGADAAVEFFQLNFPKALPEEIRKMRLSPMWQERLRSAHTLARELRAVADARFDAAALMDLDVPVLLMLGESSPHNFHASAAALCAGLPRARLAMLPRQRHRAMDEIPEEMAAVIRGFLDGTDTGR